MAPRFGALAILLVRADVLCASSPNFPFMDILWTLTRFYADRLLSRSKSVHAILIMQHSIEKFFTKKR